MSRHLAGLLIIASVLAATGVTRGQAPAKMTTTIRVKDMHCEHCAAKIRKNLFLVAGVINVQTNVKAHVAVVVPQQTRQPSPRAMWEAVEKAGFDVVQLAGPLGTFAEKPLR
jgi:copper chaperone CopZ